MGTRVDVFDYLSGEKRNRTTRQLLSELRNGRTIIVHLDPRLDRGGSTKIKKTKDGNVSEYSWGQNWSDQKADIRTYKQIYKILVKIRKSGYYDGYHNESTWIELK